MSETVAELELWHSVYEEAVGLGHDPVRAVEKADAALAPKPEPEPPDWRNGYRVMVPRTPVIANWASEYQPPTVMEYDEVFLSPHELRELAIEKLDMRSSESPLPEGEARADRDQRDRRQLGTPSRGDSLRRGRQADRVHPSRATGDDHQGEEA